MDITSLILELFTNADHFLMVLATEYGWFVYLAMFLIFFLETGIVVLAFLPGDSLLFVSGTVAAAGTMSPWGLMLAVILGACLGNTLGFHTGRWLGNKIYDGSISWIDIEKLRKTQIFYEKHGGKTIVLARFVPIVRAFAPLVAGAARMSIARFELYSGLGACIWAVSLIGVGYLFGNILTIGTGDLLLLAVLSAMAICAFVLFLRPLVSVAFDAEFARSQRLPVTAIEYAMMAFIALTIVACLRMVGIVLVISLLTIPQVTANLFTRNFRNMAVLSVVIGYAGCLGGLALSYCYNIPSGASIIFVSILIYLVCKGFSLFFIRPERQ